jgi:hypothetical protein
MDAHESVQLLRFARAILCYICRLKIQGVVVYGIWKAGKVAEATIGVNGKWDEGDVDLVEVTESSRWRAFCRMLSPSCLRSSVSESELMDAHESVNKFYVTFVD